MERRDANYQLAEGFVRTSEYFKADGLLDVKSVLFLHGLSGCGKTEIAKQLGLLHGGGLLINCINEQCIGNDLIDICNKKIINLANPVDNLQGFLQAVVSAGVLKLLILDDVEDIAHVSRAIPAELGLVKVIVTTQKNLAEPEFLSHVKREHQLKMEGFTREEAKDYLNIPDNRLDELLECIGPLPISLSAFKGALQSNQLDGMERFISRYISDMNKGEKNPALRCIMEGLKRALADNDFYVKLVKHLSMFSRKDITVDILIALTEELDSSKGFDVANDFVNCLIKRSLCIKSQSDTGMIFITIHNLVKKAMESLVKEDEKPNIIRIALQAFSRIMPLDGRNHQYFIFPKMLEHGLSLLSKLREVGHPSLLTQLLHGQLRTSIGYCMISHGHDMAGVIRTLVEGLDVFHNLFSGCGCSIPEVLVDSSSQRDAGAQLSVLDAMYRPYIKTLQQLHRVTPRDFEVLFKPEKYTMFHEKLKEGHLTKSSLVLLERKGLLLPEDVLVNIYPLELLAFHLHKLSRAYESYGNGHLEKAVDAAVKADSFYNCLKQIGVPLLGMYVNKRHLLALQKNGDIDTLLNSWKELIKANGKAFECGIVRIIDLKDDKYHQLLCLQGQLQVCGRKANIPAQRASALAESEPLIKRITALSNEHKKKHITLSRSYQNIAKFHQSYNNYGDAITYLIKSMMEYSQDCSESQEVKTLHPELDDDMRKKFDKIYDQLVPCVEKSPASYQVTIGEAVEYIESLNRSWQDRCNRAQQNIAQAGGDQTYSVLLSLVEGRCYQASF